MQVSLSEADRSDWERDMGANVTEWSLRYITGTEIRSGLVWSRGRGILIFCDDRFTFTELRFESFITYKR